MRFCVRALRSLIFKTWTPIVRINVQQDLEASKLNIGWPCISFLIFSDFSWTFVDFSNPDWPQKCTVHQDLFFGTWRSQKNLCQVTGPGAHHFSQLVFQSPLGDSPLWLLKSTRYVLCWSMLQEDVDKKRITHHRPHSMYRFWCLIYVDSDLAGFLMWILAKWLHFFGKPCLNRTTDEWQSIPDSKTTPVEQSCLAFCVVCMAVETPWTSAISSWNIPT